MNGTQSPDAQKALNANSNGSNSNNSSLAAKKRKKDLKPIITMEGANQADGYVSNIYLFVLLFLFIFRSALPSLLTILSWFWQTSTSLGNFMVTPCSACRIETARTKSAWYTQVICGRWSFARDTAVTNKFWCALVPAIVHPHRIRGFASDMKLRSRLAYIWRVANVNGGPNHKHHPIQVSKKHSTAWRGMLCHLTGNSREAS
ncbi:hypothetical protein FSHL1_008869 [Fusarium sambucinum]